MKAIVSFESLSELCMPFARLLSGTDRDFLLTRDEAAFFLAVWPCTRSKNGPDISNQYLTLIPTQLGVALVKLHGDDTLTMIKLTTAEADQLQKELADYPKQGDPRVK